MSLKFSGISILLCAVAVCGCAPRNSLNERRGKRILRLAFFPNVTHAAALVGTSRGQFSRSLGQRVTLEELVFNAGPAEVEALFGGQVDIGYIGPGPALNGFLKSRGKALKIIAGASSGGAALVARADSNITEVKDLAGKRVASPQTGGTQDISLRHALHEAGLGPTDKGGSVAILPVANPDTLTLFVRKELDAAWVPEPWVSRLAREAHARIVIDERDRWPGRRFATTVVIVRSSFLQENADLVGRFLEAHIDTVEWIQKNPDGMRRIVSRQIEQLTQRKLPEDVLTNALSRTDITFDPLRASVLTFADWSKELGFQREGREALDGLIDLKPLHDALARRGRGELPAAAPRAGSPRG